MFKKLFLFIVILGVFGVFYLSWLPQPRLENYWFMPNRLGSWADVDGHKNIRTAVPFLFLGGFIGSWLFNKNKSMKYWILGWLFNLLVVSVAEFGQLFLKSRTADFGDIFWGGAGAVAGLAFIPLCSFFIIIVKFIFNVMRKSIFYGKSNAQYT